MIIKLKKLNKKSNIKDYVSWMNNYKITKYLDQHVKKHTKKTIIDYINFINKSKSDFLFGIFVKKMNKYLHVGNIKLGRINDVHRTGMISLFVGDKKFHNQNIGSKAISKVCLIAKKKGLFKVYAGCHKSNISSQRAFLKNNFFQEGVQKRQVVLGKKREDLIWYGLFLQKK